MPKKIDEVISEMSENGALGRRVAGNAHAQNYVERTSTANLVVKSNDLIQKASYDLSTTEQRIVLSLIQQIKPTDQTIPPVAFTVNNFCSICGLTNGGGNYLTIKDSIKSLADKSVWAPFINQKGEKSMKLMRWIENPVINMDTNEIYLKLDDMLQSQLLNLKDHYTKYNLHSVIVLKSQYSIRLYEILKSYQFQKNVKISVDELRQHLTDAEDIKKKKVIYPVFADFRRFVIESSIKEINKLTEINVDVEYAKTSRKVTDIIFTISSKKPKELLEAAEKGIKKNSKQTRGEYNDMYGRRITQEEYENAKKVDFSRDENMLFSDAHESLLTYAENYGNKQISLDDI